MGDRCYVQAWVRREDYAKFCEILVGAYVAPRVECGEWILYEDGEANYGSFDERMEAAKNGLIFVGESSGGWEYDAEAFYSDGVEMYSQDISSSRSSSYTISIDPVTGKLDEKEIHKVNEFEKKWREMYDKVIVTPEVIEERSRRASIPTSGVLLVGVRKLEEYLFTSPGLLERFLKDKFIPAMDEVFEWPLCHYPSGLEYRRHPSGVIDFVVNDDDYITISRAFQSRTVTVNKVGEVEEKTYGEWKEVPAQVEVTFCRYRKGVKIVG